MPAPATPNSADAPRSASLMMKTRVAVRDKTPHRFQVVPLRDAAQQNRDKAGANSKLLASQPPAPWIRQLAVLRPSGVGLGLGVVCIVLVLLRDLIFNLAAADTTPGSPMRARYP